MIRYAETFRKIFQFQRGKSSDPKSFDNTIKRFNSYRYRYKEMDDNEIFKTLVQTVFFSGMNAKTVGKKLPHIFKHLGDFRKVANYTTKDIEAILKDENMIRNPKKVEACVHNAKEFLKIVEKYGSFSSYICSFNPKDYPTIKKHLAPELQKKFSYIGPINVYHFLMDLGLPVMKPDRTIQRLFYRLGWIESLDISNKRNIEKTIKICTAISKKTGLWIRTVDIVLVSFCQEDGSRELKIKRGTCTTNPKCSECPLQDTCKYYT